MLVPGTDQYPYLTSAARSVEQQQRPDQQPEPRKGVLRSLSDINLI